MANDDYTPSGEVLEAARRLIPERGSGIDSITISTSGMGGRSVTLTPEDGPKFDRALREPFRRRLVDQETGEVAGTATDGEADEARVLVTDGDPDARAPIPGGHRFQGRDGRQKDFTEGRDIQDIADALIEHRECFAFLSDVIIRYRWRRKAQVKAGRMTLGYCQKLSGQLRDEMQGGDFQIVLNAENCRDLGLTNWQIEALVAHELMHIAPPDPDDPESQPSIVGHDAELFSAEIDQYGLWKLDLRRVAPSFVQAKIEGL
jgi:hypothetical protein